MQNDVKKAKDLILLGLELRNQAPEIFFDRDPLSTGAKTALNVIDLLPLPKLTKDGNKLILMRLNDSDTSKVSKICISIIAT